MNSGILVFTFGGSQEQKRIGKLIRQLEEALQQMLPEIGAEYVNSGLNTGKDSAGNISWGLSVEVSPLDKVDPEGIRFFLKGVFAQEADVHTDRIQPEKKSDPDGYFIVVSESIRTLRETGGIPPATPPTPE